MDYKKNILLSIFYLLVSLGSAQDNSITPKTDSVFIEQIIIIGNNKTKEHIIIRELDLKSPSKICICDTALIFKRNQNKIFNTGLFNFISLTYYDNVVLISVEERWYIWPIPIFELSDRSFNEWWNDRGHDFNRVNYGIDFEYRNFRGRRENLHIKLQHGFTHKYEIFYTVPYLNSFLSNGLKFSLSYSTNRNIAYRTNPISSKLDFSQVDFITRKRFYTGLSFTKRPKYYIQYGGDVYFNYNQVHDTITSLNPHFFSFNKKRQKYLEITLRAKQDKRDIQYYPYHGHIVELTISKKGLGIFNDLDFTRLHFAAAYYRNHKHKVIWENILKAQLTSPHNIPYYNHEGLGYGENLVRGYELSVVDGNHYILAKESIKFKLLHRDKVKTFFPVKQFSSSPLSIFLHPHIDIAYVQNNNRFASALSGQVLLGYGIGLDIIAFYDAVLRVEYSWGKNNIGGFYLHADTAF